MIHPDETKTSGIRFTHDPASACGAEALRAPLFGGSPLGVSVGEMLVSMERDRLGSFRTARLSGDAVSEREYTPYGGDYTDTGAFLLYGFTGHLLGSGNDPLYYAPHRNYSPTHARWLTRDPLGMIDGTNVYGYVRENPVREIDPLGLSVMGTLCRAGCWALGADICAAVGCSCAVGEYLLFIVSVGTLDIILIVPCSNAIIAACAAGGGAASVCSEICPE